MVKGNIWKMNYKIFSLYSAPVLGPTQTTCIAYVNDEIRSIREEMKILFHVSLKFILSTLHINAYIIRNLLKYEHKYGYAHFEIEGFILT